MKMKMNVREAADFLRVTPQAVYLAIKSGKLRSHHEGRYLVILESDLIHYENKVRYNRKYSLYNGELRFDPDKGEVSVRDAAERSGEHLNTVYYLVRSGQIPYVRKGSSYVFKFEDFREALGKHIFKTRK